MSKSLTILHTNDFHNHLTPEIAAGIRATLAAAGPDALLVDAGDAISAGNVGVRIGGEPILTLMSNTGYCAMTMGNREFHVADGVLRHKIGNAEFPVLSANMAYKDDADAELPVKRSCILTTPSGIRVGIFGLTVPMVTLRMAARHVSAFVFDEPLAAARREIDVLRPSVDVLVLLSHVGYKVDLNIASSCPELDLIIGGHTHVVLDEANREYRVPVVQAGSFARFLGRSELRQDDSTRRWTLAEYGLEPLK